MSNRIRKSKHDNIKRLNESLLSEDMQSPQTSQAPPKDCWKKEKDECLKCPERECNKKTTPCMYRPLEDCQKDEGDDGFVGPPGLTEGKQLNEDCGCGGSKGPSKDNTHGDWIEGNLTKIDQMVDGIDGMSGDIGGGGCGPGKHWCNETGDCHDDHSPQTEPLTITGMEIINLQERIGKRIGNGVIKEQTNPFSGGSGPNWDAAEQAWANWSIETQSGAPTADQTFLDNMANKSCEFYDRRLTAQVNSFVNQFGGSFGGGSNLSSAPHAGSNPAWQSQKYARIMWLSDAVYNCSTGGNNTIGNSQGTNVGCFYNFLNDPANDATLTTPVCNNGNQAISPNNMEQTKFRWQSISDCGMLGNKITQFLESIQTTTGCEQMRKMAKHEYLTNLHDTCC